MSENKLWKQNLIILIIFLGVIILTAEIDWAAEHSEVGLAIRLVWLINLLSLGLILPIGFVYLAGNKESERRASDKKWFILAIVLFLIANGIPIIFYMILGTPQGFLLYLQLALFGLIPAFIFQPKTMRIKMLVLLILFLVIIVPIGGTSKLNNR